MKITKLNEDCRHHISLTEDLDESLLTELNNPFKRKTNAQKRAAEVAKADKEQSKIKQNGIKLLTRDLNKDRRDCKFYLAKPDGTYSKPMTQQQIQSLWTSEGAETNPEILNAIVVTPMGYLDRKGMEDFAGKGISFDPKNMKLNPRFKVPFSDDDTTSDDSEETTAEESAVSADTPETELNDSKHELETKATTPEELNSWLKALRDGKDVSDLNLSDEEVAEIKSIDSDNPEIKNLQAKLADGESMTDKASEDPYLAQNNGITKGIIDKFRKIAMATGLTVNDAFDKPVNMDSAVDVGKITPETLVDYTINIKGKDFKLSDWLTHAVKNKVITEDMDESSFDVDNTLLEAPQIMFSDDELNNPDNINFKKIVNTAVEKEKAEKAEQELAARRAELQEKHKDLIAKVEESIGKGEDSSDTLQVLHDALVPPQGKAETCAGELVRAMMRLLYRSYNDGDKFYEGYGLETCASSAEYLYDNGLDSFLSKMLDQSWKYDNDDSAYDKDLETLAGQVIEKILAEPELISEPCEEDSREYNSSVWDLEEEQPRYEFECYASDDVEQLVNEGIINAWDLQSFIENSLSYDTRFDGAEVERPWSHTSTTIEVTNLTKDGLETIEDWFNKVDNFWEELVEEHRDELNALSDDDYDDEEDFEE